MTAPSPSRTVTAGRPLAYVDVMQAVVASSQGGRNGVYGGREIVVAQLTDRLNAILAALPVSPTDGLDAAYRERNALVAALIRVGGYPAQVVMAPDTEGWWIVYIETPEGQLSWHISPDDMDLFSDWPVAFGSKGSPWDGHTTTEKYERLARLEVTRESE